MNDPNGLCCCKCSNFLASYCELSGWSLLEYIIFCHTLWWIFYFFLLVVTKQSEEWCCRLITFFHGCLISYCALRDAYINKSRIDFKRTPLSASKKHYLSYMFSYFLFDFCWIHFFGNEAKIIYAHHIASILIIFNILLRNIGCPGIDYGAAGLELTNPYLQLRWFLRTHGYQDTPIHKLVELWFMLLFSLVRVLGGTVLVYNAVIVSDMDYLTKLTFIFIYGISMVLQWQIVMYFRKKYLLPENRVLFIRSRVSISLYFQRRTLDHFEQNYYEGDAQNQGEILPLKESISSKKRRESSVSKESTTSKASSTRRESSARRKSSTGKESSASKESSEPKESQSRQPSTSKESSSKQPSINEEPTTPSPSVGEDAEVLQTGESLEENFNPDEET